MLETSPIKKDRPFLAFLWMLASAIGYAGMSFFVKRVTPEISEFQIIFFRSLVIFLFCFFYLFYHKQSLLIEHWKIPVVRSLFGFVTISCYLFGISHLPLTIAAMLHWMSPVFVILFARFFLNEDFPRSSLFLVLAAFIGLALLLNLNKEIPLGDLSVVGVVIGIFGAVSGALAYTALRAAVAKSNVYLISAYFSGISLLLSAPPTLYWWKPIESENNLAFLAIGIFGLLAQISVTNAYQFAPASLVSMMSLINALCISFVAVTFLGESLAISQWGGVILLLSSLFFLAFQANKKLIN